MDNQNSQTVAPFQLSPAQFPRGIIDPGMLAATPTQALGDIYYSDGSNFVRLPIGTANQLLAVSSSLPAWISYTKASQDIDGWTTTSDSFVFASSSSFTISGVDRTSKYTKGTRIKLTNNGSTYYGVVISSSFSTNTTVNLAPNNDFSLANSAITNPFYSYVSNPQGYPTWFNQIAANITVGGGGMTVSIGTVALYKFASEASKLTLVYDIAINTSGTPSNAVTFSLPVAPDSTGNHYRGYSETATSGVDFGGSYYLSTVANIQRYDTANFSTGGIAVRGVLIYGF